VADLSYEVSFKGTASDILRSAFDDCVLRLAPGRTIVSCQPDALNDVLDRLQGLGLELLDVRLVAEPAESDDI
jgi:hypothetical protein